jgi:hypothetical protein
VLQISENKSVRTGGESFINGGYSSYSPGFCEIAGVFRRAHFGFNSEFYYFAAYLVNILKSAR